MGACHSIYVLARVRGCISMEESHVIVLCTCKSLKFISGASFDDEGVPMC